MVDIFLYIIFIYIYIHFICMCIDIYTHVYVCVHYTPSTVFSPYIYILKQMFELTAVFDKISPSLFRVVLHISCHTNIQ